MADLLAIVIVLMAFSSDIEGTTVNNRPIVLLFDNFGDVLNVPPDIIDTTAAHDPDGVLLDISGHGVSIFGLDVNYIKMYDTGFIDCDSTDTALTRTVTADGDLPTATSNQVAIVADKCMIAAFVAPDLSQTSYEMAYGIVDATKEETLYKIQGITREVNRAKDQYRDTWVADFGVIVTWKITGAAGTDKFQVVLAVGDNKDGSRETYVLFLYEDLPLAGTGLRGQINGKYAAASPKFARICADDTNPATVVTPALLKANSNYKCGRPGMYVFGTYVAAPLLECNDPATACTGQLPGCNQTSIPKDTCTESFFCMEDSAGSDSADLTFELKWYQWKRLQAIDYEKYDANEEQEFVHRVVAGGTTEDACGMDLPDPGTEASSATFTVNIPKTVDAGICGTSVDTTEKYIAFCFKNYDNDAANSKPTNRDIDQFGDTVYCGKCYFEDLPRVLEKTVVFNDFSPPTFMPPRDRRLILETIDRGDADGYYPLTAARIGRLFWLLLTYDPGTPFHAWTEPFAATVKDCWASNNADFTDSGNLKAQKFIEDGCPVDKVAGNLEAVYLTKSFEADTDHLPYPPDGSIYYQFAGPIIAAKWRNVVKIWFKCTTELCTDEDEIDECDDPCTSDKRKRRSIEDEENLEVVYTQIDILPEEPESEKQTCRTTLTTTIVTETVLLALLLVMVVLCVFLALKLGPLRKEAKKRASLKKIPSY